MLYMYIENFWKEGVFCVFPKPYTYPDYPGLNKFLGPNKFTVFQRGELGLRDPTFNLFDVRNVSWVGFKKGDFSNTFKKRCTLI